MFNLEQQISAWRQQMLAAGIKTPALLDELEFHLRDDITRQVHAGIALENAFQLAVHQLGPPGQLKPEFQKLNHAKLLLVSLRIVLVTVPILIGALFLWLGEGLREFAVIFCLVLSLALPLFAGPQPATHRGISGRWFRIMLAGQILLGLAGALIIFSPLHPLFGLSLAAVGCALFVGVLRRQSRASAFASQLEAGDLSYV